MREHCVSFFIMTNWNDNKLIAALLTRQVQYIRNLYIYYDI